LHIDLHRRWILNDQQGDAKKLKNSDRKAQLPSRRPEETMVSVCVKARRSTMRLSKVAALALVAGTAGLTPVSLARAASDCSISVTLADWGENSTGDIDVASGGSCQLPIRLRGTVSSSDISQKPAHGKLKKLNISTYEYTAKSRYKGSDSFAVKAMGQGPTGSGTSVITVRATIK
jgi:hypothetical protein